MTDRWETRRWETRRWETRRWETRHSPAEMIYLEVTDREALSYLHGYRESADRWSFEEVVAGAADYLVRSIYGEQTLTELKTAVKARMAERRPE